jgi:GDPmannose 4,6-dehydratase
MSEKALVVGIRGQDGTLLARSLACKGLDVVGISRERVYFSNQDSEPFSIYDANSVERLIRDLKPKEIYYLAAHHSSAESREDNSSPHSYERYHQAHVTGLLNCLSAIRKHSLHSRLFYAASSLIYDGSVGPYQNEDTPFRPVGFYGATKLQGLYLCRQFREAHGVFAAVGILYSHESILRRETFLSKKLISSAHLISKNKLQQVQVGSFQARNDWGYAPDYVEVFQRILSLNAPSDFVVASGESHSVRDFATAVFERFGLDASQHVFETPGLLARETPTKTGDITKLTTFTGWTPPRSFSSMIEKLADDYLSAQTK